VSASAGPQFKDTESIGSLNHQRSIELLPHLVPDAPGNANYELRLAWSLADESELFVRVSSTEVKWQEFDQASRPARSGMEHHMPEQGARRFGN